MNIKKTKTYIIYLFIPLLFFSGLVLLSLIQYKNAKSKIEEIENKYLYYIKGLNTDLHYNILRTGSRIKIGIRPDNSILNDIKIETEGPSIIIDTNINIGYQKGKIGRGWIYINAQIPDSVNYINKELIIKINLLLTDVSYSHSKVENGILIPKDVKYYNAESTNWRCCYLKGIICDKSIVNTYEKIINNLLLYIYIFISIIIIIFSIFVYKYNNFDNFFIKDFFNYLLRYYIFAMFYLFGFLLFLELNLTESILINLLIIIFYFIIGIVFYYLLTYKIMSKILKLNNLKFFS